ncbi:plasmid mobilization protein [Chryseobacterium sp. 18068]|uniref:plasmid mobilization protein n=1 Tax=Chryseobacterium sp. 18068 TaxID=2681414 RepID=UPI0013591640|nr:plasmid mobilization relaxosome protein MobC [Chryseobacterium sp. 18068]
MSKKSNIIIRIDSDEKDRIVKKANHIGLSLSEYLRQLCIYGDAKVVPESVIVDLRRIGINMNQITKRVNGGSISKDKLFEELDIIITELKKINLR